MYVEIIEIHLLFICRAKYRDHNKSHGIVTAYSLENNVIAVFRGYQRKENSRQFDS